MNNYEIENILIYNKNFLGCYASDQIDILPKTLPKSLIINTANSGSDGEHWVALVLQENRCFYFDYFGLPIISTNILHFLHNLLVIGKDITDNRDKSAAECCYIFRI